MKRKYVYYFNKEEISKKEFVHKLQMDCQKVIGTEYHGYFGVDIMQLDKKKFNENMRAIEDGSHVVFLGSKNKYYRREVR
jgi:hypothetical protein